MPLEGLGARHTVTCTKKCKHGQIVTEEGFVGTAFKISQMGRYVDPTSAAATDILVGEEFEMQLPGIHEAPAAAGLAAGVQGSKVWITVADNTLTLTTGAGKLPVGVVDDVDFVQNPDALRINSNAWQAFLPGA